MPTQESVLRHLAEMRVRYEVRESWDDGTRFSLSLGLLEPVGPRTLTVALVNQIADANLVSMPWPGVKQDAETLAGWVAPFAIRVAAELGEDRAASFHLQFHVLHALCPGVPFVVDLDLACVRPGDWLRRVASDGRPPDLLDTIVDEPAGFSVGKPSLDFLNDVQVIDNIIEAAVVGQPLEKIPHALLGRLHA